MQQKTFKNNWTHYLTKERGFTHETIRKHLLAFNENEELIIPIFREDGAFLFEKYRKAPWDMSYKPKYVNSPGSKATLYNLHNAYKKSHNEIIICEGEFDAITLDQLGFPAVTSTNGSSSFKEEWKEKIKRYHPVIWFDNDEAGIQGALHTAKMFQSFTYAWVPKGFGKDINDLYMNGGEEAVTNQMKRAIRVDLPPLFDARDYQKAKHHVQSILDERVGQHHQGIEFLRMLLVYLNDKSKTPAKKKVKIDGDQLQSAKQYPISNLLPIRNGFATYCPFHNPARKQEHNPSFKIYTDTNTAFCFGACNRAYDAVDIYQQVHGIKTFKETLKEMTEL